MTSASVITIKDIQAIPIAIPLKKPMHMSGVVITHAKNLIVRIEASNGLVGWGEAASAPTMTGDILEGMVAVVNDYFRPLVLGKRVHDHASLMQKIHQSVYRNTGAKCALECALLDLCGQHLQVPVYDLIGGAKRRIMYPMTLLGSGSSDEDLKDALSKLEQGITFFKIKVGVRPLEEDIQHSIRLRTHLGNNVTLCADANMGLDASQTIRYCEATKDIHLLFFEQPLHSGNLIKMAQVAKQIATPLCGDESISTVEDIQAHYEAGAIQGVNLKIIKSGGISQVIHAAHICEHIGFSVNLACKVAESSISAASLLHTGAVIPNINWGISITNQYLEEDLVMDRISPKNGAIELSNAPGLGITVNESQIHKYKI